MIPGPLWDAPLSPAAFRVAVFLVDLPFSVGFPNPWSLNRTIDTPDLAAGVNLSVRSVQRALAELKTAGVITEEYDSEYLFAEKFGPENVPVYTED